jgi:hypothetical protein
MPIVFVVGLGFVFLWWLHQHSVPAKPKAMAPGSPGAITYGLNASTSGKSVTFPAGSTLIVQLPPPGQGRGYSVSGDIPPFGDPSVPFGPNMPVPFAPGADGASFTQKLFPGTGTMQVSLTDSTQLATVYATYSLTVTAR